MTIHVKQVHKHFKDTHALKGVDLSINQGMFGLLGPNGAGKTSLMRIIMGLVHQDQGQVEVFGKANSDREDLRQLVSYLPQHNSFYPTMTVYEAMDYMGILCGMKDKVHRKTRIKELLQAVNLYGERKKRVKALSGGMKKRLGLAQVMLKDPRVLIVDEPTAGLDPEERLRIRNLLADFSRDRIVIFSTHIVEDIAYSCDHLAVISSGEILFQGLTKDLVSLAEGSVWTAQVDHDQVEGLRRRYQVTSLTPYRDHVSLRIIGDQVDQGQEVQPTLEDAYMYLMKRGKHHVQVPA